ncbi:MULTISPECIES: hypothetical protein [unclassified Frondihabitans]|uniref:hypothetical protein n=1 Tax=unclassified Frondihabitans TaxID=2626248 RepID=UPI000F4E47D7|nr:MULTISPECIES: hypothetical protein [unclassified Frondihabitans]RPE78955.1 hypothetical protein EDF37_1643 [Frondihabitans sp. PhB153]RPF09236.1 hypothetical protein EDF39_1645 [Frondihabitans sp. PhB161]
MDTTDSTPADRAEHARQRAVEAAVNALRDLKAGRTTEAAAWADRADEWAEAAKAEVAGLDGLITKTVGYGTRADRHAPIEMVDVIETYRITELRPVTRGNSVVLAIGRLVGTDHPDLSRSIGTESSIPLDEVRKAAVQAVEAATTATQARIAWERQQVNTPS